MHKIFSLSLGGSLLFSKGKLNIDFIKGFSKLIDSLFDEGFRFAIVVGGGFIGREYISAASKLNASKYFCDMLGIEATKLNAMLIIQALKNSWPEVLSNAELANYIIEHNKIPVFSGMLPGITTDCVAALVAEATKGIFVNLTDVDGIYNADPKKNPNARLLKSIHIDELIELIGAKSAPGQHKILDLPACLILKRSKIRSFVLNGKNLKNLESFVKGKSFIGTEILT